MLGPKGNVPQRAAVCCSSYPLHQLHISGAPDAHRSLHGVYAVGWNSTALNHFPTLLERGCYSFLKPASGRWGQHTITISSPSERTSLLQNTVLLHGGTWLFRGKCPRGKSEMPVVRMLLDLLKAIISFTRPWESFQPTETLLRLHVTW